MEIIENKEINNNFINKIFGTIIQNFRIKNHLTQEQLAEKLGVSTKYMSKVETGIRGLSSQKLINNNSISKQLELSEEINCLPDDKLEFIIRIIKDMKELK